MSFLHVLLTFFCAPLDLLLRGRILGFICNAVIYTIAVACLITVIGIPIAVVCWLISMAHGMWSLRGDMVEQQATMLAQKMATVMKQTAA